MLLIHETTQRGTSAPRNKFCPQHIHHRRLGVKFPQNPKEAQYAGVAGYIASDTEVRQGHSET